MKIFNAIFLLFVTTTVAAKEVDAHAYFTDSMLDSYVYQMRGQLPLTGTDGTKILSVNRQGRTLIFGMHSIDSMNQQTTDLIFNSKYKKILCLQESESFMLKRKVNMTWNYFDRQGKFLATASLTTLDCGY